MKILHIINSLETAGAEKLILDSIPLYRELGIEADVLLLWDHDCPFTLALKKLNCCKIHIISKSPNKKNVYNPLAVFRIRKIIKQYDIAHVHVFPSQYFAVFANILNKSKTKLVLTEHNTLNGRMKVKVLKPIERFIYSKYEKIICITDEVKNIYLDYLEEFSRKFITINNGVDINQINKNKAYRKSDFGYHEEDQLLIMVARFNIQKDQDTVIKSLVGLPVDYKLLLVGDGERRMELEKLVIALNLSERVNFLGIRSDVYSLYKMCDFAVLSSHWEGFGLVAVEAMACGIPIIASKVDGLAQIVKNAGILFEKGNTTELSQIILSFKNNEEKYQMVVQRCLQRSKHYDITTMVNLHVEVYKSLLLN
ncbi:glycosyltransferase [Chryseobacterium hagamense]|uniref:Glycosyl transferase n=1 Tax=Chryseobacterium hagamense TaxID=395935 RepID=A0A511YLT1_9FLAO|nr:glycosyltransferase [Chryseobacterium hagamense]GEN76151.1 glycosyl transferase [Chryseobacterium hagamense]